MRISLFWLFLIFAWLPFSTNASEPQVTDYVHYDYVDEQGLLRGGVIKVDPTNRFHKAQKSLSKESESLGQPRPENYTAIVNNGSPKNRLDIVTLGDGYQAGELDLYHNEVDGFMQVFFNEPPFNEYMTYFNVHRVDVVSQDSGVSNDPNGVTKNTALDAHFFCSGIARALCVDVTKAKTYAAEAPEADSIIVFANTGTYGGVGYPAEHVATVAGGNPSAREVVLHELGHSLALLWDEYEYGGPNTYSGPESPYPNVSIYGETDMRNQRLKWFRWLDESNVGTFEGANYSLHGIYRPTFNSRMRNLGHPYEQVNTEQIIINIYKYVKPIDDASPAGNHKTSETLWVNTMKPTGHDLKIQWYLNDQSIQGATGDKIDLSALGLIKNSLYTVKVTVVDNTPLVRDESARAQYLTQSLSWNVYDVTNKPPVVNAGPDESDRYNRTFNLKGSVTDDGLPSGHLTIQWAMVSGPGTVTFDDSSSPTAHARVSKPGDYVLRLTASDGEFTVSSTMKIHAKKKKSLL